MTGSALREDPRIRAEAEALADAVMRREELRGRGLELEVSFGPGPLGHRWWFLTLLGADQVTGAATFLVSLPVSPELMALDGAAGQAAGFLVLALATL